jgi:hypothetical protein
MRHWRIAIWIALLLIAVIVGLAGDALPRQIRLLLWMGILLGASIFFFVTVIGLTRRRNIDREMSEVERTMSQRDEFK